MTRSALRRPLRKSAGALPPSKSLRPPSRLHPALRRLPMWPRPPRPAVVASARHPAAASGNSRRPRRRCRQHHLASRRPGRNSGASKRSSRPRRSARRARRHNENAEQPSGRLDPQGAPSAVILPKVAGNVATGSIEGASEGNDAYYTHVRVRREAMRQRDSTALPMWGQRAAPQSSASSPSAHASLLPTESAGVRPMRPTCW
mmetsp:Transcript_31407/g.100143  ORF Transcript_31407/g.100143 Transcript_31407/m.100143 type:complete len:203 (+) Transcript_31407:655-1263(+)